MKSKYIDSAFYEGISLARITSRKLQVLTFSIIAILSVFTLYVSVKDFRSQYNRAIEVQAFELKQAAEEINYLLKSSKDQLNLLEAVMVQGPKTSQALLSGVQQDFTVQPGGRFHVMLSVQNAKVSLSGMGSPRVFNTEKEQHLLEMLSLAPFFKRVKDQNQNVQWLYFVSRDEMIILYPETSAEAYVFDYGTMKQDFYVLTLPEYNPEKHVIATKVYEDEVGAGLMVTLTRPVYKDNTYIGALAMDFTLEQIQNILEKHRLHNTSYQLVNQYGEVLGESGDSAVVRPSEMTVQLEEIPWTLKSIQSALGISKGILFNLLPSISFLVMLLAFTILLIHKIHVSNEIYNSQLKFSQVVNQAVQLMAILDPSGKMLYVNQMALQLIGAKQESLIGKPFEDGGWWNWSPELIAYIRDAVQQCNQGESSKRDVVHYDLNGQKIHVEFTLNPIYNHMGEIEYLVANGKDITDRILLKESMERLTKLDMLTNIMNRRGATEALEHEIARAIRQESDLSIVLLDVDYFKKINDTFGHNEGDRVLIEITQLIQDHLREYDLFGRWGGEEFIAILPGTDYEVATEVAQRLCDVVAQHNFFAAQEKTSYQVTITLGASAFRLGMTLHELVKSADDAMYRGKRRGRNQVGH